ncbi:MAG: hypothetical protein AB7F22_07675 [Reyranella sp.]|uniref:hypothetical protein n=1 Tax=Reyranella sp. TaxID=1929291 RepID=UPI003D0CCB3D
MAHFRGTVQGIRGQASRLGSKASGLEITANGWDGGVTVRLYERNGKDWARITLTGGSGYSGAQFDIFNGPIDGEARAVLLRTRPTDAHSQLWPGFAPGA